MLSEGDQFYIGKPKEFRGLHFTVINEHSDEFECVDQNRNPWNFTRGERDFLVYEPQSKLSASVYHEDIYYHD